MPLVPLEQANPDAYKLWKQMTGYAQGQQQANPNQTASAIVGSQWDDLCQAYVENQKFGVTGIYPNAISAWNNYKKTDKAVSGLGGIKPGDLVYFGADNSNGNNGHTGIYEGNNMFTSATSNGVKTNDLNNWQKSTGQQLLGYVPMTGGSK